MSSNTLVFLDVDGVLNDHSTYANGYCGLKPECVAQFNRVLQETSADIVLSSAWRYLVLSGSMDLRGLTNLFLTHGLDCYGRIVGVTPSDEDIPVRGRQIRAWLNEYGDGRRYVVIDDMDDEDDFRITANGHPMIQTDGNVGMTEIDADWVIEKLFWETI